MNLICFMVLLIFGVNANNQKTCKVGDRSENIFFHSTNVQTIALEISETLYTLNCTWNDDQCYVECIFVNHITNSKNVTKQPVEENYSITDQIVSVFQINEQETICNVTKCASDIISKLIQESSNSPDLRDLKRPAQIKKMCSRLFASDSTIKKVYIRAEKKYIDYLIGLLFHGTSKNYDFEELNMTVVKMDMMNTTDLGFVHISAPKARDDLPLDVFLPTEPFINMTVGVVTYPCNNIFINDPKTMLKSKVIRIETVGHEIKNLSEQLVINFTVKSSEIIITENHRLSCLFYNVDATAGQEWDDMGSFTNLENFNSSNSVNCSYDHMTPFAVLLVDMNVAQIDRQQWKTLSIISYIGCSFSSFFSAVTIFLYTFMKSSNRDTAIHIHVSLSAALFLLNISFLFTEWGATWSQNSACVLIAVIIEYSLLSCFSWMAIEAIHLYFLLIKVFNTYIKHYMIKLSLFGWGMPALLVGGSLCAYGSTPFYGTTEITLSDTNEAMKICWITDIRFLYGINIGYFSIMFLFNTSILVAVTCQIYKRQCMNVSGSNLPSCKDICTVLGLTFLLGMTWGLAFFTSGHINYPVLYLFCICNTLQGLFLFLWFYATMKNRLIKEKSSTVSEPTGAHIKTCESTQ
ncbi:adhesion G protein-coupled receptor G3-like [Tachysurus vachellii]|uniref:adhesion G protein-coupled receptor G3-like n=1 Tax=Tachysurus vachellii TaxID=175792 RepID=UPI00296AC3C2|nr:adhesion G protein-coupled receptor G3-like [Tachysurus vachellii]